MKNIKDFFKKYIDFVKVGCVLVSVIVICIAIRYFFY